MENKHKYDSPRVEIQQLASFEVICISSASNQAYEDDAYQYELN